MPVPNERGVNGGKWAKPVERLHVSNVPAAAINLNVDGRRLTGPLQGFGQLWQKTYRIRLKGVDVAPSEVVKIWKKNFACFWPKGNRFYGSLAGIEPGDVVVLNLAGPAGMPLSTGILVIYADDESFSFMTPEGHMFAGMNTFSAYTEESTIAQIQCLVRANDPLWEILFRLGITAKMEDSFWTYTLQALAAHWGASGEVEVEVICVDPKVQWTEAKNVWYNVAIRSAFHLPIHLLRGMKRKFLNRRKHHVHHNE
jgi:hypothetical protein